MEDATPRQLTTLQTVLLVPVAVVCLALVLPLILAKPLMMPFQRKRRMSAENVAELLRHYIAGTATEGEQEYFESCELADPQLEAIRAEAAALFYDGNFDPAKNQRNGRNWPIADHLLMAKMYVWQTFLSTYSADVASTQSSIWPWHALSLSHRKTG